MRHYSRRTLPIFEIITTIVLIFFTAMLLLLPVAMAYSSCGKRANIMGMKYSYGVLSGCMIEVRPNQWIPIDSYYFDGK